MREARLASTRSFKRTSFIERIAKQKHPHVLDGFMAFAATIGITNNDKLKWHIPLSVEELSVAQHYKNWGTT